jgi:hypothetical protein
MPAARSLLDSMDRYKLANGVFPSRFADIDVTIPNTTIPCSVTVASYADCVVADNKLEYWIYGPSETGEGGMIQIRDWKHQMTIEWYSPSRTVHRVKNCIAYTPAAQKACIALGGEYIREYYYSLP